MEEKNSTNSIISYDKTEKFNSEELLKLNINTTIKEREKPAKKRKKINNLSSFLTETKASTDTAKQENYNNGFKEENKEDISLNFQKEIENNNIVIPPSTVYSCNITEFNNNSNNENIKNKEIKDIHNIKYFDNFDNKLKHHRLHSINSVNIANSKIEHINRNDYPKITSYDNSNINSFYNNIHGSVCNNIKENISNENEIRNSNNINFKNPIKSNLLYKNIKSNSLIHVNDNVNRVNNNKANSHVKVNILQNSHISKPKKKNTSIYNNYTKVGIPNNFSLRKSAFMKIKAKNSNSSNKYNFKNQNNNSNSKEMNMHNNINNINNTNNNSTSDLYIKMNSNQISTINVNEDDEDSSLKINAQIASLTNNINSSTNQNKKNLLYKKKTNNDDIDDNNDIKDIFKYDTFNNNDNGNEKFEEDVVSYIPKRLDKDNYLIKNISNSNKNRLDSLSNHIKSSLLISNLRKKNSSKNNNNFKNSKSKTRNNMNSVFNGFKNETKVNEISELLSNTTYISNNNRTTKNRRNTNMNNNTSKFNNTNKNKSTKSNITKNTNINTYDNILSNLNRRNKTPNNNTNNNGISMNSRKSRNIKIFNNKLNHNTYNTHNKNNINPYTSYKSKSLLIKSISNNNKGSGIKTNNRNNINYNNKGNCKNCFHCQLHLNKSVFNDELVCLIDTLKEKSEVIESNYNSVVSELNRLKEKNIQLQNETKSCYNEKVEIINTNNSHISDLKLKLKFFMDYYIKNIKQEKKEKYCLQEKNEQCNKEKKETKATSDVSDINYFCPGIIHFNKSKSFIEEDYSNVNDFNNHNKKSYSNSNDKEIQCRSRKDDVLKRILKGIDCYDYEIRTKINKSSNATDNEIDLTDKNNSVVKNYDKYSSILNKILSKQLYINNVNSKCNDKNNKNNNNTTEIKKTTNIEFIKNFTFKDLDNELNNFDGLLNEIKIKDKYNISNNNDINDNYNILYLSDRNDHNIINNDNSSDFLLLENSYVFSKLIEKFMIPKYLLVNDKNNLNNIDNNSSNDINNTNRILDFISKEKNLELFISTLSKRIVYEVNSRIKFEEKTLLLIYNDMRNLEIFEKKNINEKLS